MGFFFFFFFPYSVPPSLAGFLFYIKMFCFLTLPCLVPPASCGIGGFLWDSPNLVRGPFLKVPLCVGYLLAERDRNPVPGGPNVSPGLHNRHPRAGWRQARLCPGDAVRSGPVSDISWLCRLPRALGVLTRGQFDTLGLCLHSFEATFPARSRFPLCL